MAAMANKLVDAVTTLVGWINYSATDPFERVRVSAEVVKISTPLDAAGHFTFIAQHPGAAAAVTYLLELAPELMDGTIGTWVTAASVAVPAAGGQVEATISGGALAVDPADAANVKEFSFTYARCTLTPDTPAGAYAGLTYA